MRLLEQRDGEIHLTEDLYGSEIQPYAILSHTWGHPRDEVNFVDVSEGRGQRKAGYEKIIFCSKQAAIDNLRYFWVDSCCINRSSSAELQEAIISMFSWYRRARKCYVYMADVSAIDRHCEQECEQAFRCSKYFTRGWTLQELLAPNLVEFYSREGMPLGNKKDLEPFIQEITGIEVGSLRGVPVSQFEIDERISWAKVVVRHALRTKRIVSLAFSGFQYQLSRVSWTKWETQLEVKFPYNSLTAVFFSPNGATLATGNLDGTTRVFDRRSLVVLHKLERHKGEINAIAFSPNNIILATGSDDGTTRLWNYRAGTALGVFEDHRGNVNAMAFSPDGRTLATGSSDSTVRLWDSQSGVALDTIKYQKGFIRALAFSPTGMLVSGGKDRVIMMYDYRYRKVLRALDGHKDHINTLAFSPNNMLASASLDRTVKLWNGSSGTLLRTIGIDQGFVRTLAFSLDGPLVTGSSFSSIKLWDIRSGAEIHNFQS